jgi:hypothetical protein
MADVLDTVINRLVELQAAASCNTSRVELIINLSSISFDLCLAQEAVLALAVH